MGLSPSKVFIGVHVLLTARDQRFSRNAIFPRRGLRHETVDSGSRVHPIAEEYKITTGVDDQTVFSPKCDGLTFCCPIRFLQQNL